MQIPFVYVFLLKYSVSFLVFPKFTMAYWNAILRPDIFFVEPRVVTEFFF